MNKDLYISKNIKEKNADKIMRALQSSLPEGEKIAGIFWITKLKPLTDVLVVTNCRVLSGMVANVGGSNGFFNELTDGQIQSFDLKTSRLSKYPRLVIKTLDGTEVDYGQLKPDDAEAVTAALEAMHGDAAPLTITREYVKQDTQQQVKELEKLVVGSVNPKILEEVTKNCQPGEKPQFIIGGFMSGALAAFDNRCIVIKKGAMTALAAGSMGGGRVAAFSYADITGIEYNSGLMNGVLEILTASYQGTANKDFWSTGKNDSPFKLSNTIPLSKLEYEQARPQIEWLKNRIAEVKRPQAPAQETKQPMNVAEEIAKLADLHSRGLLDDEEFQAVKKRLLEKY